MYKHYLELLKTIYRYHAMIFYSQYNTRTIYQLTVGIKNENCTLYIQRDCRFPQYVITAVYHNDKTSRQYELEQSELTDFLDMHLMRKETSRCVA